MAQRCATELRTTVSRAAATLRRIEPQEARARRAPEKWSELVTLWEALNLHVANVIERTPRAVLSRHRVEHNLDAIAWETVPGTESATLEHLMVDSSIQDPPILPAVRRHAPAWVALLAAMHCNPISAQTGTDFVRLREFIAANPMTASVHASTIVAMPDNSLLTAWFGGSAEGRDDVEIWMSRKEKGGDWSNPRAVTAIPTIPLWNPVLLAAADTTWLFFKAGPSPREWVGAYVRSRDNGRTWDSPSYLPAGLIGPVRTKPLVLDDDVWLAGSSVEAGYRWDSPADAPYRGWAVWVERTADHGRTWTRHGPVTVPGEPFGVIQPTLWRTSSGEIRMLMRSTERIGRIVASSSHDGGRTWTPAEPTELPNPNAGIDVVRLEDGHLILVYNHLSAGRNAIHLAWSRDEGESWSQPHTLEEGAGEYSYPAVIQSPDGLVHITYTWQRTRIRHVVIDPERLEG